MSGVIGVIRTCIRYVMKHETEVVPESENYYNLECEAVIR